ncbi:hypothetical protein EN828_02350 [Mesorhizobium sp. M2D.F.Ca.ET.185.01.1.1]|uniref:hypothetical protein n=1 Tax=unclassified Mesorhizobium TaxID=325217 RepID=UPI000FCC6831|nr:MULTISPECIES: hypothetical protein [unclassified Mesorhizobium]TGP83451.1 hypothetical protein EN870_02650 [bacterium M00.F.Ca.ET.227.01.1.1]TGP99406.1 hypothetical protein EN864_06550 [bacterium M00.F.Ca.ET.221.01.1.1]TGU11522.1 hypothetical protein EN806_23050 [bacterium M00.F.Ca.ET.163.01.1.1]TGU35121.1 hypothetical protein EN799_19340 [bacterium M00.F.Ca.ET.156.01.1.1]TGU51467.1 hypothetical protein EN789_02290 [bacterium M00.F.Ca.ET.146.01.1.1]TGV71536.1 hypothetical protein EN803_065
MADFVSVLKKQLDKKADPSFEVRKQIYDGARAVLAKKLAEYSPPLAPDVVSKQKRSLEDAISSVERDYVKRPPAEDPLAELEHIFSSIDRNKNQPSHARQPAAPEPAKPDPFKSEPFKAAPAPGRTEPSWQGTPKTEPASQAPAKAEPAWQSTARTEPSWQATPRQEPAWQKAPPPPMPSPREDDVGLAGMDSDDGSDVFANDEQPAADTFQRLRPQPQRRKRSYGGLIAAVVALLVLAGGGYGIWLNKNAFGSLFGLGGSGNKTVSTEPLVKPAPAKPATETAAAPAPAPAATSEPADTTKFTQRLTPEGKETDPGPAGGQATIGEGESVAALTSRPPAAPATAPAATGTPPAPATQTPAAPAAGATPAPATSAANPTPPAAGTTPPTANAPTPPAAGATPPATGAPPPAAGTAPATPAPATAEATVPVGQKAIFYEERTSTQQGTAEPGSIVWSLVQESPGGDLPPEPAIRAEATIPGKNIQLRMTIRRNADQTLPASHIIEMIFLTPKDFDGGGVDGLLRIAMKSSEQDAGSPLIGLPAKIGDGFFLVALNDTKADVDANLTLLRGQAWIDVPVVYKTGRRALLTMEKGIPGEKVFDEALKAWAAKTSG